MILIGVWKSGVRNLRVDRPKDDATNDGSTVCHFGSSVVGTVAMAHGTSRRGKRLSRVQAGAI